MAFRTITSRQVVGEKMEIPDYLTWLLRNLYAGREAIVRILCGTTNHLGSRLRKEYDRAVRYHPVCLTYMLSTSWEMLGWMSYKLELGRWEKHQQSQTCVWYHSNGRKWREIKEPLDEGEGGEWKSWLKNKILKKLRSWHPAPLLHAK